MTTSTAPTIVLVHGAFADASGFGGVIRELQNAGHTAVAAPNPLRSLAWDAAAVVAFVIPPDAERFMADRMGASTKSIAGSHTPFITQPVAVAGFTEDHLDALLSTNIKGVVLTVQKAVPLVMTGPRSSSQGRPPPSGAAKASGVSAATKAAVRSLARTWANELRGQGIRVNVIVAGSTATPGRDNLAEQINPGESLTSVPRRSHRQHTDGPVR